MSRSVDAPRGGTQPAVARPEHPARAFDRLIAWIDRLPIPAWVFYALVTVVAVALGTGLYWMDGVPMRGPIMTINIFSTLLTTFPLVMMQYLKKNAGASLEAFRPALGKLHAEYPQLGARLTTMSTREVWIAVTLGVLLTAFSVAGNPAGWGFAGKLSAATATYILLQGT